MNGANSGAYHARCWAEGKDRVAIQDEIAVSTEKARHHHFQWNEVGNVTYTWARVDTLTAILLERR